MDRWKDDYEECEVTIDIECDELPEEVQLAFEASHHQHPPIEINRSYPKPKPKLSREIRLSLKSNQLKERFISVIESVPGRQVEANNIYNFISAAENGSSAPLCLHGNTGCGKTSLITKILEFFEENSGTVNVAYLNCMSIRTVNLIYVFLLERFYGGRRRVGHSAQALRRHLVDGIGRDEQTKIVVLDEIDHVIGEQNFLYNMLEWLSVGAKLILVLISNVIDLAVRLDSKLQSRWKFETIIFQPYSHLQIQSIILHKYANIRLLCKIDAIGYIAKRIYNINSDIRTLDKIYNRITQTYAETGRQLGIDAVKELIYDESKVPPMPNSYLILTRILHRAEKRSEVSGEIFQRLFLEGSGSPKKEEILYMLCDLQDTGLITLTTNRKLCDLTFHDYGIKIHENLRLYIENSDK